MRIPSLSACALILFASILHAGGASAGDARMAARHAAPGTAGAVDAASHRTGGARADTMAAQRSLPIRISADRIKIDQKSGMAYYRGHVTFVQGGLRITASKGQASMRNNAVQTISAEGNPITFFQKMPAPGQDIRGSALRLKYYSSKQRLDLYDEVRFRQGSDTLRSATLHYDIATGTLIAVARSAQDQVHVVIQPSRASAAPASSGPIQRGKGP
ncbi:MAG: lipopolysaccharide transport periplasmic protein LptA [Acidiferrobacterales bacterium]